MSNYHENSKWTLFDLSDPGVFFPDVVHLRTAYIPPPTALDVFLVHTRHTIRV